MKHRLGLGLVIVLVGLMSAQPASATLIVDTGPGPDEAENAGWCLGGLVHCGANQWLAAEFVITSPTTVSDIWGWMYAFSGSPNVQIAIYSDGGNVPASGAPLYISSSFVPGSNADWYGVSGLSWSLTPGQWWVAFQSNDSTAAMPWPSDFPLANYAAAHDAGPWFGADQLDLGVRIEAVPEPATLLLLGGGLVGLASRRRRVR